MPSQRLAEQHIAAQERIRELLVQAVTAAWDSLPSYDEENVRTFVDRVVPLVGAAQRQAVAMTEAFLSRSLGQQPIGVPRQGAIGAAVRSGTDPEDVYRRPFVTVWTALKQGTPYDAAVGEGRTRAQVLAQTDVQLAMRATLQAFQERS